MLHCGNVDSVKKLEVTLRHVYANKYTSNLQAEVACSLLGLHHAEYSVKLEHVYAQIHVHNEEQHLSPSRLLCCAILSTSSVLQTDMCTT